MTSLTRRALCAALVAVGLVGATAARAAEDHPAARFVRALGDEAIAVLSDDTLSPDERHARYRELLDRGFAVDTIARFAIGRFWRSADEAQRREYLGLFRDFVLETYAARLDSYAGERFEVLDATPVDARDTLVETVIRSADGPPIRVSYRVRANDGDHRIIDVLVEGVSLITTQRQEFGAIIARGGVEGLLASLRRYTRGG